MNCLKVFSSCLCCDFKSTVMAVDRTERGLNGMDIVKVSIMGICGMMLGFILKETRPEFATLVTMMTGFLILGLAAGKVSYLFETMNRLKASWNSSYLTVLVKIIGIIYRTVFICNLQRCRISDDRNTDRPVL